jgi:hypothetical protein
MSLTVFLVEEASMEEMLRGFLPALFPDWVEGVHWRCIPHEGKSDLEASIPRKLRGWRQPGVRFVVMRDQDSAACEAVKANLRTLCANAGRPDTLIRIPCRELEAWYLGDLAAVDAGLGTRRLAALQNKRKYREPDRLGSPSNELAKIAPYQKRAGSRAIGPHLDPARNRSHSFGVFVTGLRRFVAAENSLGPPSS